MKYKIPLPRLLDGSMNEVKRLHPFYAACNLQIKPLSTATLELPKEEEIPARSFVEIFTSSGSAGIYRTRAPQNGYGDATTTVQLEHAICEVGDYLVKADLEEETTARAAIQKLFTHYGGTKWQLGTIESTAAVTLQCDYVNVLQAILEIMDQIPDYMLVFDQSSLPWKIHVRQRPTAVSAEGRLSRNVQSVRITEDDSELCTRVYMEGLTNGYMDADTISTYGVVEKQISGDEDMEASKANRIASLYLEKHKKPALSIEIDAQDLASVTGESLDALAIGKRYRLTIPQYDVVKEEIVTSLSWTNIYEEPGAVEVTLSEKEETVVSILHTQDVTGGRSGGASRKEAEKKNKTYVTWMDRTDRLIDMGAAQLDEHAEILKQAGMSINADGVLVYADSLDNDTYIGSKFRVQSNQISLKVTKGNVATQLAVEAGNVTISGGNLVVSGYVTATQLGTVNQRISDIIAGDISFSNCVGSRGSFNSLYLSGSQLTRASRTIDGVTMNYVSWYGSGG